MLLYIINEYLYLDLLSGMGNVLWYYHRIPD